MVVQVRQLDRYQPIELVEEQLQHGQLSVVQYGKLKLLDYFTEDGEGEGLLFIKGKI